MREEIVEKLQTDPGPDPDAGKLGQLINGLGVVFAVGILAAAAILVIEIFLRYALNAPTIWAHETVIFLSATAFIFGGLYVVARNAHIRVVLIYDILPQKIRRYFDLAISIACFLASGMFAWAAWKGVERAIWTPAGAFRLETSGSAWNPPTPGLLKLFLLFILIVMTIQFLVLAISYFKKKSH
ncbi:TRAP transporter small permease subunit [Maritalea mediterranea]|uniref:TRAP transporter small permease protein n=1 Tax=Maritalea mediterranea TaxID=2909667 RepID=A0ABS9E9N1_9HYPH|nr:TRAP transporter small permease [Maritalea mediterranea]MCF4098490.1 TRAP transporter small permease [Maritalea mediterranea]